jgi:VWFA-related protein
MYREASRIKKRVAASELGRIKRIALLLLLFGSSLLYSQSNGSSQEAPDKDQPTFKVPVNVITVNATVSDSMGNPVKDLTQNDFSIYDDGELQTIQTFAMELHEPAQSGGPTLRKPEGHSPSAAEPSSPPPRMTSIFIDDITADSNDRYYAIAEAVEKFIANDMGPEDQVAIFSGSGKLRFLFSNDKQMLLDELANVLYQLNMNTLTREECPEITDLQAQMIVNRRQEDVYLELAVQEAMSCMSLPAETEPELARDMAEKLAFMAASRQYEESEYRSRTLLQTLRQHIRSLRHFEGTKSVVLFSDGFLFEDVVFELQDVVDQALYSGVIVNTVDDRGLFTYIPPAGTASPSIASVLMHRQQLYQENQWAQETPLSQLASDTGGLFHHNSNDLYEGLQKISNRHAVSYVLTYARPNLKPDGRYHRIKLEVLRPGLKLSYRKGYYAPKEELTFERRKKEDILEALQAPGNLNEIPISLGYNYYQEDDSIYNISFLATIKIRGLHFLNENSRHRNIINLVVAAFDEYDNFIKGLEKSIDFRLTEASYTSLLNNDLTAKVEFGLPLGRYKIKAVVREGSQGKMGSITKGIEIP